MRHAGERGDIEGSGSGFLGGGLGRDIDRRGGGATIVPSSGSGRTSTGGAAIVPSSSLSTIES